MARVRDLSSATIRSERNPFDSLPQDRVDAPKNRWRKRLGIPGTINLLALDVGRLRCSWSRCHPCAHHRDRSLNAW